MEGLIPFVYRAVMQIRYGDEESSSVSTTSYYVRLPSGSTRFERSGFGVSDLGSSSNTTSSSKTTTTTFGVTGGVHESQVSRHVAT
ncbi:unnamed protein product [Cochlearia groenlandica]